MPDEETQEERDKIEFFNKWIKATMTPLQKPHWFAKKRMAEYQAMPGANGSSFLHDTPAHMRHKSMQPPEANYAFSLGDAFHIAVLEPDRFDKENGETEFFQYSPTKGLDTKAAKEAFAADPTRPLVTAELISKARYMRDAIWNKKKQHGNHEAHKLLSPPADTELSGVVWDNDAQIIRKIRIDFRPKDPKANYLVDLKSCDSCNEFKFWSSIKKFRYGGKSAFYLDTESLIENRTTKPLFYLIAVEGPKGATQGVYDAPYLCRVFEIGSPEVPELNLVEEGRAFYLNRLSMFANAARTNCWEGYEHQQGAEVLYTLRPQNRFFKQHKEED